MSRYLIAGHVLDLERGRLSKGGVDCPLRPRSFALLRHLVENLGRVVSRDELLSAIWPNVIVSDDSLTQCITDIRRTFGPDGDRLIQTLARRGYMLREDQIEQAPAAAVTTLGPLGQNLGHQVGIAVLPFQTIGAESETAYFSDGITEEIITALSRFHWLNVAARSASYVFRGDAIDVATTARELGVRYVLTGSVRRSASRVRISGRLVDTVANSHIWADRFEDDLSAIFELQDKVTNNVVAAIEPKIERAEMDSARARLTSDPGAYDSYLRGLWHFHNWTEADNAEALRWFRRAFAADARFGSAYAMAARCYSQQKSGGWLRDREAAKHEVQRLAGQVWSVGKDNAQALAIAGNALGYVGGALDDGVAMTNASLVLNPASAAAWMHSAWPRLWRGDVEEATAHALRALALGPQDPERFQAEALVAWANLLEGKWQEAHPPAMTAFRSQPIVVAAVAAAMTSAMLGRYDDAVRALAVLAKLEPELRAGNVLEFIPLRLERHQALARTALERAFALSGATRQ